MRRMDPDKGVVGRFSPNVWTVGDLWAVGETLFRCAVVYPEALFEVVDDEAGKDRKGVSESDGEGAV